MIPRTLTNTIKKSQKSGFINIIYGPRQVGKTVLLKQLADAFAKKPRVWFNGDHQETRTALSNTSQEMLKKLVDHSQIVFIDEAQRIPNIGLSLKILIDTFPKKIFFATGSSSLTLSHGVQESLVGRNITYKLYPLSTQELTVNLENYKKQSLLENQLIFGGYPHLQMLDNPHDKREYLHSLIEDYLFRDVTLLKDISSPENLRKLAILLAFQLGSEVSFNELANNLHIDIKTVMRYISLLKLSFVIFEIGSFAKNLRKEVAKSKKYYFWDLGIRNALIDQFSTLELRPDKGSLWENFLIVERLKKHEYRRESRQYFFWRTYEQAEIDWIEKEAETISAYEFKWQRSKIYTPKAFKQHYQTNVVPINKDNYLDFIL